MRFNFTGKMSVNALDSKFPYVREGKAKNNKSYMTWNSSVEAAKNNRANVEMFGMVQDTINTFDSDKNKISIEWNDRNDSDVVSTVASFRKHVINLTGDKNDRKEFIADYDAVKYLVDNVDQIKDKMVTVTGNVTKNIYQGKMSDRFQIQNIYVVDENTKPCLKVTAEVFFNKDSYDFADWKSEKKITLNCYTNEYIDKSVGNKMAYLSLILDCSKLDFANEMHISLMKFKMKQLGLDYVDGMPKCILKGNNYYSQNVVLNYYNGAEEVEFTEDMLTPTQKEYLALGIKTLDDFRPSGSTYGNRVTVYKIVDFDLRGKYEDGYVDTEMKASEFEEEIYVPQQEEKIEEVLKDAIETPSSTDEELEDLFG